MFEASGGGAMWAMWFNDADVERISETMNIEEFLLERVDISDDSCLCTEKEKEKEEEGRKMDCE